MDLTIFPITIDPSIIAFGPLALSWYGLMLLVAFIAIWGAAHRRRQHLAQAWSSAELFDYLCVGALGALIGGRLGYPLFYNPALILEDPIWPLRIWESGLSFHGSLIGAAIAIWVVTFIHHRRFFEVTDFIVPIVPIGLIFGRIGEFLNGELLGRATESPFVSWAFSFLSTSDELRHPSQLYQAVLEGFLLLILLWLYSAKQRPRMAVSGLFLMAYSGFRIVGEFFRQPDAHIGYDFFNAISRGQLLSVPVLIIGFTLLIFAYRQQTAGEQPR